MLRQIVILIIVYLLNSLQYSQAAKQDYILSIVNQKGSEEGYIKIEGKSAKGNSMSVCSWIKQDEKDLFFFLAIDYEMSEYHLRAYSSIFYGELYAATGEYEAGVEDKLSESSFDCNLKNLTSWFHVCIIKSTTSFLFYLNGFPSEYYTEYANISAGQSDKFSLFIGDVENNGGNSSLYQLNAFDRVVTAKEAKNMYNCKFMNGDLVSWNDITSKSNDFRFGDNIKLIQAPVPCPTPPPYNPIDCNTGEPLEDPSNTAAGEPGSSSSSGDSGSSSQPGDSGSSSPSEDSGSSSTSGDSGSSSPSGDSGSSSPSKDSGSSSPSKDSGSSSQPGDSGSSTPSEDSGSSSTSGDSGSSSPSGDSGSSSPSKDSGSSSPNAGTAQSSGN